MKISEKQLYQIISESIKKILKENLSSNIYRIDGCTFGEDDDEAQISVAEPVCILSDENFVMDEGGDVEAIIVNGKEYGFDNFADSDTGAIGFFDAQPGDMVFQADDVFVIYRKSNRIAAWSNNGEFFAFSGFGTKEQLIRELKLFIEQGYDDPWIANAIQQLTTLN